MTSMCGGGNAAFKDGEKIEGVYIVHCRHPTVAAPQLAVWNLPTVNGWSSLNAVVNAALHVAQALKRLTVSCHRQECLRI